MTPPFTLIDTSLTPRVTRLRARLTQKADAGRGHKVVCRSEQEAYARLACEAYSMSVGKPEILRRAEFLGHFAANFPIEIREDELIIGSQQFTSPPFRECCDAEQLERAGIHTNHGHIIVDYGRVLRQGLPGLRHAVAGMPPGEVRTAFADSVEAFAIFIERHDCPALAARPPATFHEALQLTWFIQVFLSAEGLASALSFGRFDQYIWPFLRDDLERGSCSLEHAYELLCCFFLKCCEGAESQNLTVGGPGENPLSILVLQAMRELQIWQPSISVRISDQTSDGFWDAALGLCKTGIGMPSFFNDPVVIGALRKLDIPPGRAADWGIVGCYEASPQGDALPLTVGGGLALPEILHGYLQTLPRSTTYEAFENGFRDWFTDFYRQTILPGFARRLGELEQQCSSPFESVCVTGCIESGLAAEQGGARFKLFGVNILGIGTLIDSLLAIRTLVFDECVIDLPGLTQQLTNGFPDRRLLQRCRSMPGKFGSDSAVTNEMARAWSTFIAGEVLASRLPGAVRPYPGFFWFGQDIHRKVGASPDGRLNGERLSYGCGPGELLETPSITGILNAAACIDHGACACGNPLTLSFRPGNLGEEDSDLLRQIIETYFANGGFHLHVNIVNAAHLIEAKAHPERYRELTVRISGFSARFVDLDSSWQDAIIERTARSM